MEINGTLVEVVPNRQDETTLITFKAKGFLVSEIPSLIDKDLRMIISRCTKRKSRKANDYFHVLNDKIAGAIGSSRFYTKNLLIAKYGERLIIDDVPQVLITKAPPEYMLEQEMPHTSLYDVSERNGATWYSYRLYLGVRFYDSRQMSKLIDGTVYEAKQLGIETLPPMELERMKAEWGKA